MHITSLIVNLLTRNVKVPVSIFAHIVPCALEDHIPKARMYKQLYAVMQNFQLKRIQDRDCQKGVDSKEGAQDPVLTSPQTVILPEDFVKEWKHCIESLHPPRAQAGQKQSCQHEDVELEVTDVNTSDQQEASLPLSNNI